MTDKLFEYRQTVRRGYHWAREVGEGEMQWATPPKEWFDDEFYYRVPDLGDQLEIDSYYLVSPDDSRDCEKDIGDYPTLFLQFSDTPLTADGILGFANQWGFLKDRVGSNEFANVESTDSSRVLVQVEPIFNWVNAIHRMKQTTGLWEMLRNHDREGLSKRVRWSGNSVVRCGQYVVAAPDTAPERLENMEPGDILNPVRYYIQDGISRFGLGGALPNLSTRLIWDIQSCGWRVELTPADLLGALSFQLANAICSDTVFRRCYVCGEWIQIAPGSGRPEKIYCSDACRMRAYRKRKAQGAMRKTRKAQRSP